MYDRRRPGAVARRREDVDGAVAVLRANAGGNVRHDAAPGRCVDAWVAEKAELHQRRAGHPPADRLTSPRRGWSVGFPDGS